MKASNPQQGRDTLCRICGEVRCSSLVANRVAARTRRQDQVARSRQQVWGNRHQMQRGAQVGCKCTSVFVSGTPTVSIFWLDRSRQALDRSYALLFQYESGVWGMCGPATLSVCSLMLVGLLSSCNIKRIASHRATIQNNEHLLRTLYARSVIGSSVNFVFLLCHGK